jgi:alkylation response protein AidB-like acyl-CoA dehydrogenase
MTAAVELAQTAERFLADQWPLEAEQPARGVAPEAAADLWRRAAGLGWAWIARRDTPEQARDSAPMLAALFGVLGRHPAPVPAAELAISLPVLAAVDGAGLLAEFCDGERLLAFATQPAEDQPAAGSPADASSADTSSADTSPAGASWAGARWHQERLTGVKIAVACGAVADAIVVSAWSQDGPCLVLVERDQPGVVVDPMRSYDRLEVLSTARFTGAAGTVVAVGEAAERVARETATLLRASRAAELAGLAAAGVMLAVQYTGMRTQFGRPIGSFQAVKHLLADAWIDVYAAESAGLAAARQVAGAADDAQARSAADRALSFAAGAARRALEASLQAHGGIGFTLDYRLNWYFNRVLSRSGAGGSPREARIALGHAVAAAAVAAAAVGP